jgi:hypothetical protein
VVLWLLSTPTIATATSHSKYTVVSAIINELGTTIPKDIIRAIAWGESGWTQYNDDMSTYRCSNNKGYSDWGVMQINDQWVKSALHLKRLKENTRYNIKAGVAIFEQNLRDAPRIRKKYKVPEIYTDIDIALKLYNGWGKSWQYVRYIHNIMRTRPWDSYLEDSYEQRAVRIKVKTTAKND